MLIFDQLRKDDPQLRMAALFVLGGLGVLLVGLWWVQVVSYRDYQESLETQSYRTVRVPAVRGRILDRSGIPLAETRPSYAVSLYLDDLQQSFRRAYARGLAQRSEELARLEAAARARLHRNLTKAERSQFRLKTNDKERLRQTARYSVASNVVAQIGQRLCQPLSLTPTNFERHYLTRLALPYTVMANLTATQIAVFEEQCASPIGVELEVQPNRVYPFQTTAGHVLGFLQRDDDSVAGEEAFFSYRLPDYRGVVGIEAGFDKYLRGTAGAKSVLVNNLGYRQTENVFNPAEPGHDVGLTLDLRIQQAAERALQDVFGPTTRGAVVALEVDTGDILALASSPTINPNHSVLGFPPGEIARRADARLLPVVNRATFARYQPGSIFKTVIAMACLEDGLNPNEKLYNPGYIMVGNRPFHDLAAPGLYDFRRALIKSSNTYFIHHGLDAGAANIVRLVQHLHLTERMGLPTRQEAVGTFPTLAQVSSHWTDGNTANLCIGQGEVSVTPLQMAVLAAAIANGGNVLWPRLVASIQSPDRNSTERPQVFPNGRVRDQLGVKPRTLSLLREAMVCDVEGSEGTGKAAAIPGYRICGKTGTAQKKDQHGILQEDITWFLSFAPYEKPRYAVVAMVEGGASGGSICAPIARKVYQALLERDRSTAPALAVERVP